MKSICIVILTGWVATLSFAAEPIILKASKDTFGRSNKRNRNNGASETLVMAGAPNIRSLIAFDLSSVSNEIVSAELRFHPHETAPEQVSFIVAPMTHTERNAVWKEGIGNLGVQGQNARLGESCFAFSAFRDVPWESSNGEALTGLNDAKLWETPAAGINGKIWQKDRWVRIPINDVSVLEGLRKDANSTITFGVWGTSGDGLYYISSNNSQWAPELHLELKESRKK